ncbi:MAG: DinB family protein [Actinomycetota bacterium]|nr:DinB family protein [Actinomycetota bacterium]
MTRTDPATTGGEPTLLSEFLDYLRETIAEKTDGLDEAGLAATHPPATMTLGGMLKHLTFVEDYWAGVLTGGRTPAPWDSAPWEDDPDWDWHSAAGDAPERLREQWRAAVQRSQALLPGDDLDRLSVQANRSGEHFSVRWILIHLVEEYGRHCGHADLIRESIDGTVGE